ncbi:hypothetical protein COU13_00955 [Candidatus Kaiserbacteria bacterium CG10_big_fil_rev_8_21_14_0_10_43_70]|uniref:SMC-Scp complex subunit ScpB n=1 Tax=Candidatus Kaiserbacteria bacterium CG10_big_fil_rev_8_21_14_0_10_43_70 TaxID=1974605 RepID=A0A2H0UL90_9BACT|nr:MAG: hypothetical protein COU13_00955 [Candidatus Kaiserbacteria bacterium CG10_big_fil_rev_8_21_14_0_10_43_70]
MDDKTQDKADLAASLEAILLIQGDVIYKNRIPKLLECSNEDAERAVKELDERIKRRENSGITLIQTDSAVGLSTAPFISEKIASIQQKFIERDIGTAGLEVIAILLYIGSSTRSKIDYIRGVNSSSTVRLLLIRKLIERIKNPNDSREYVYRPTIELLAHIGISSENDLPDFEGIHSALVEFSKGDEKKSEELKEYDE